MPPQLARVIKTGGRVQRDGRLARLLARLWMEAPGSYCVVHGGGETISSLQARLGHETRFVAGRRITTGADIEVLRMALSGLANKQLVSYLSAEGIAAVGLSGEDGSLIVARTIDADRLGRSSKRSRACAASTKCSRSPLLPGFSNRLDTR